MNSKKIFFFFFFSFIITVKLYFLITFIKNNDFSEKVILNSGDAGHYYQIAKNIHDFSTYSDNGSTVISETAAWRPPFWPFVLASFLVIAKTPLYVIILKTLFEVLLISLVVYYNKRWFTGYYGLLFFILLIEPQYLKYSAGLLSESLTAILILILSFLFLKLNKQKKYSIILPIISGITILCHPVSAFFIISLFCIYVLYNLKSNFKIAFLHGMLFIAIVMTWPIRNNYTYHKGFFLTASQGATFAKGWNEKVVTDFTNVDGDLADEEMNLKYIKDIDNKLPGSSILTLSKLYKEGTYNYIKSLTFEQKTAIIIKKIKSNFNPFPEKPKPGFFEDLSIFFRILYLVLFAQLFRRLFQFRKFNLDNHTDKAFLVILSVFIGQIAIASYIYTGLRFNTVYSLCLLFCFLVINQNSIQKVLNRVI